MTLHSESGASCHTVYSSKYFGGFILKVSFCVNTYLKVLASRKWFHCYFCGGGNYLLFIQGSFNTL